MYRRLVPRAISPRQTFEPALQGAKLTVRIRIRITGLKALQQLTSGQIRLRLSPVPKLRPGTSNGSFRDRHQRAFGGERCSVGRACRPSTRSSAPPGISPEVRSPPHGWGFVGDCNEALLSLADLMQQRHGIKLRLHGPQAVVRAAVRLSAARAWRVCDDSPLSPRIRRGSGPSRSAPPRCNAQPTLRSAHTSSPCSPVACNPNAGSNSGEA